MKLVIDKKTGRIGAILPDENPIISNAELGVIQGVLISNEMMKSDFSSAFLISHVPPELVLMPRFSLYEIDEEGWLVKCYLNDVQLIRFMRVESLIKFDKKCQEEINSYFVSETLGKPHWYSGKEFESWFVSMRIMKKPDFIPCKISEQSPTIPILHTIAQLNKVKVDFDTHFDANYNKYHSLKKRAIEANSVVNFDTIVW